MKEYVKAVLTTMSLLGITFVPKVRTARCPKTIKGDGKFDIQ